MPDVVVIGAGLAGLSVAAELATDTEVRIIEMESTPARHASGRSAALFIPTYGPATIRRLTAASREWFASAGAGHSDVELLTARPVLFAADSAHIGDLDQLIAEVEDAEGKLVRLDRQAVCDLCPAIRPDWVVAGAVDQEAHDLDVSATVDAFRRILTRHGGVIDTSRRVVGLARTDGGWTVGTTAGTTTCDIVVNAAGAWVDEVATLAGLAPLGFEPRRRTLAVARPVEGVDPGPAFVAHAGEHFYFGAEAGGVLFSPADETPSMPCDAKPDELDIAAAIDGINAATRFGLRSVSAAWAGLRTFGPDGSIVVGPDPSEATFIWCGGQGGYGVQTAPAAGRAAAALTRGQPLPPDLIATGLTTGALGPARFA